MKLITFFSNILQAAFPEKNYIYYLIDEDNKFIMDSVECSRDFVISNADYLQSQFPNSYFLLLKCKANGIENSHYGKVLKGVVSFYRDKLFSEVYKWNYTNNKYCKETEFIVNINAKAN